MTIPEPYPGAYTDMRRATAITAHYVNGDAAGINAIIDEANLDPRPDAASWLLLAVLDVSYSAAPVMNLDDPTRHLNAMTTAYAREEQP